MSEHKSHIGHSLENDTWFVRVYGFETEAAAQAYQTSKASPADHVAVTYDHIERLQRAVEGECDGLMIDGGQALAILSYVFHETPSNPPTDQTAGSKPIALISEGALRHLLQDTGGTFRISAPKWPTKTETVPLYLAPPPATDQTVATKSESTVDQTAGSKFGSIFPRKSPEEVSRDPAYRKVQQELSGLRASIEGIETAPTDHVMAGDAVDKARACDAAQASYGKGFAKATQQAISAVQTFRCDTGEFLPRDSLVSALRAALSAPEAEG
ncbi:hypothetical protein [Rhizobium sp. 21-4511-3d]